jgi:cell wall-associated NlpC family hydrolase
LWIIIDKKPKYLWGGSESEEKGIDCSGYLYLAAKRAGIPVHRTTAIQMEAGLAGWKNKKILLDEAEELDLVWWTWKDKPNRPHGHIGVFLINNRGSKLLEVSHSSTSKGVVVQQLRGGLLRDISSLKRLTIGDTNTNGTREK